MSDSKQKLSAHDCDMLRSFANNGDAAGLIVFVEERFTPNSPSEPTSIESPKKTKAKE